MSESLGEQLQRVELMADGSPTWDLSENDRSALRAVLASLAASEQECERLQGLLEDANDRLTTFRKTGRQERGAIKRWKRKYGVACQECERMRQYIDETAHQIHDRLIRRVKSAEALLQDIQDRGYEASPFRDEIDAHLAALTHCGHEDKERGEG